MEGGKQFVHCREVVLLSECPLSEVLLYIHHIYIIIGITTSGGRRGILQFSSGGRVTTADKRSIAISTIHITSQTMSPDHSTGMVSRPNNGSLNTNKQSENDSKTRRPLRDQTNKQGNKKIEKLVPKTKNQNKKKPQNIQTTKPQVQTKDQEDQTTTTTTTTPTPLNDQTIIPPHNEQTTKDNNSCHSESHIPVPNHGNETDSGISRDWTGPSKRGQGKPRPLQRKPHPPSTKATTGLYDITNDQIPSRDNDKISRVNERMSRVKERPKVVGGQRMFILSHAPMKGGNGRCKGGRSKFNTSSSSMKGDRNDDDGCKKKKKRQDELVRAFDFKDVSNKP